MECNVRSLSWNPQIGKLLLAIAMLIGLAGCFYDPDQKAVVDCVDSKHVKCWSGHVSSTSDRSIEDLCRELAEAQNICRPERTVILLAARRKPQIDGFPHQTNATCDFEERKRSNRPLRSADTIDQPNKMAKMMCDFEDEES